MERHPDRWLWLRSLLSELKRRKVFRVGIAYGAVAFVVWQAAEFVLPALGFPGWSVDLVVVLSLLGFPLALVLAWAFEVTPEGVRTTSPAASERAPVPGVDDDGRSASRRALMTGGLAVGLGILAFGGYALLRAVAPSRDEVPEIRSLAVLPLENLAPDPEAEQYFADGMTEALTAELGQISALTVISRTSAMRARGTDRSMPEIAQDLGVEGLIEGSVLRAGDEVRITIQLVHGPTDRHLWSQSYERELRDVLALQHEVARAIAEEIEVTVAPDEEARLASARPVDPEAYTLYLKGNFEAIRRLYPDAIEYYRQAIGIDSSFAAAHAGLALAYIETSGFSDSQAEFEATALKAKAAVMRALDLDPELPEAHITMGRVKQLLEWDWTGADEAFRRGMQLSPSSTPALLAYHNYLIAMARFEEAVAVSRTMIERDPLAPFAHNSLAFALLHLGRYSEALEHNARALELAPDPRLMLMRAELNVLLERFDEALASAERVLARPESRITGGGTQAAPASTPQASQASARLGYVYAKANRREDALRILSRMTALERDGKGSPVALAVLHLALDHKEAALALLEQGYAQRDPVAVFMKGHYMFDPLRNDQRFQRLLEQMDFPQ